MASQSRKKRSKSRKTYRVTRGQKKKTSPKRKNRNQRDILIALVLLLLVAVFGVVHYYQSGTDFFAETKGRGTLQEGISAKDNKNSGAVSARVQDAAKSQAFKGSREPNNPKPIISVESPAQEQSSRPRLVIIIDDVANPRELKAIESIPLKLTPSLFPPSRFSKQTAQMAKGLRHYMVHFPMQADNHPYGAMPDTVTIYEPTAQWRARVKALRRFFPGCVYTNNHTGSLFTSDYEALYTLYGFLREEGFIFVDSRTSRETQGERVARAYGDRYLHRDVFIDNEQTFGAIRKQLKTAVDKARKQGYAIAIGHPHKITMLSLKKSLDILADVDVVYMDELGSFLAGQK